MKMVIRKFFSIFAALLTGCGLFFTVAGSVYGVTEENPSNDNNPASKPVELNFQVVEGAYEYQIEGRKDPFLPFYSGEAISVVVESDPNEIVEPDTRLTGMQLFEPGQLSLVGLMEVNGRYLAMVEDFAGKGYVIEEGVKVGRRGIVKKIMPNKVIIEEIAMTRAGKELRSEIVMALRKEGEE